MPSLEAHASQRWVKSKSDEVALDQGCWFDIEAADRVRFFFERYLRHSKGAFAGKKFELLPWQWNDLVAPAYGWKRSDGTRRFRRVGCGVPKKNGKSTLLAGLSIYSMCADLEAGAEIYSAAADRAQASIIFDEAANMVEASPELLARIDVIKSGKRMWFDRTKSSYKALSADVPTKEGLNIHHLLFDELHAQKKRDLWQALKYGGAARTQPLYWWISTAGYDRASLCWDQWQYAKAIIAGRTIAVDFLPCIYEADPSEDWTAESTWRRVNPSYGITLNAADFASDCLEAQSSIVAENAFKRYRLNMWTQQDMKWLRMDRWYACGADYDFDALKGQPVIACFDLASTTDIAACNFTMLHPKTATAQYTTWPVFWCPESCAQQRIRESRHQIDDWIAEGHIRVTPGDIIDYDAILADFIAMAKQVKVRCVALDPWNATQFGLDLKGAGFKVYNVRQGYQTLSPASKELETLILSGRLRHPNHPVLDWMVDNTAVEMDPAGNIKPSKRRSSEKIDGTVALIGGLAAWLAVERVKPSVYEKKGISHA
jgi:phage terminase large subunit-like protein